MFRRIETGLGYVSFKDCIIYATVSNRNLLTLFLQTYPKGILTYKISHKYTTTRLFKIPT